jgi:hypothetical protein
LGKNWWNADDAGEGKRSEWREGKEEFKKCQGGGMLIELNGFRMRWIAVQIYKFKMSSAWLNKPNQ